MATPNGSRFFALLQREFREYKTSLFWTPITTAVVLGVLMLGSVIFVSKFSFMGDWVLERIIERGGSGVEVSLTVMDTAKGGRVIELSERGDRLSPPDSSLAGPAGAADPATARVEPPAPPEAPRYTVTIEDSPAEEAWNFSREWSFNPESPKEDESDSENDIDMDIDGRELNFMFSILHGILLLILFLTSVNYLLSSLYEDRKDRSILFFRSMPTSEREIVLSKLVTALVVAPLIYLAVSLILQLTYVVLMMILVWRMNENPAVVVLQNIDFVALMLDPVGGWLLTALLIAPTYAWLLLASALAKRSPFLMAITPFIALLIAEGVFLGSEHIANAAQRHIPHVADDSAVGFYLFGPNWTNLDLVSLASGLVFTALALGAAVWLRQNRWELK